MPEHAVIAAADIGCISGVVVSQHASASTSRPAAIISNMFFDFNIVLAAVTATFLTVIDPSNSCTLLGRFDLIAIVSYDFVLYNTWPLSNIAR